VTDKQLEETSDYGYCNRRLTHLRCGIPRSTHLEITQCAVYA